MKEISLIKKIRSAQRPILGMMAVTMCLASCGDFFDQDSEYVIDADKNHITNASDTLFSVTGIMSCIQTIADRTILLGEVRGDLVDITGNTSSDLRDMALFNVGDDNMYNNPRDYYAIINNCNYFIANADTAFRNNRNERIFLKEYAAVKAYRAWTYLQLALNYGRVPFVTTPILTKEDADRDYETKDITGICEWAINDILPFAETEMPNYSSIKGLDSRLMFIPIYVLLGDLNLWAGHYKEAALCYYNYISKRNGTNSTYPTTTYGMQWNNVTNWLGASDYMWLSSITTETYSENGEAITILPGDSIASQAGYSQLRRLYNSQTDNDYKVSLIPSEGMKDISKAQTYCHVTEKGEVIYAPKNLSGEYNGDLRLARAWEHYDNNAVVNGERLDYAQFVNKFSSRNVHLYRRTLVYLRMAEALNRAGYPRFAYQILSNGVNNRVIEDSIIPHYRADSTWIRQFDFPNTRYVINTLEGFHGNQPLANTQGIHSRGSGFTPYNGHYAMPYDETITDSLQQIAYQQEKVEDMIVDEGALEFAFEGVRFYDLMRVALRRNDPAYLADRVYARRGSAESQTMQGEIKVNLYDPNTWYLNWDKKIGITVDSER